MNSRNTSPKSINELVKTATNKLDTTTEKIKSNLFQIISNELKHASKRERELMEGEMMLYIWALFEGMLSDENSKTEKAEYEKQYRLYAHLAKELNFERALNQLKIHENLIKEKENKKRKQAEEQTEKITNKKTNQVIGNENNTGNNKAIQEGNWIQVNGNGNVVILWGNYRDWGGIFPNIPGSLIEKPVEEKPVEEKPVEEKPAKQKPAQEKLVEEKPVEEKPVEEKPVEEKPVEEKPVEEKPVEEKPVEEKPVEEKPVEEKPVEEKPVEEKPAEEKPAEEKPVDDYKFDLTASLSDVENMHLENARYKAEEQIKEKYRNLNKSNVIRKLAWKLTLFLSRGLTRKKLIQEEMKKAKNKPFGDDAAVNLELGKGVNRQELESFFQGKNAEVVFKDIPELNQLSINFIKGKVSEGDFQTQFNTIVKNQNRQERQKNWIKNINYLGTNILEKLKFEKAQLELVNELAERLDQWADTTEVQTKIEDFLKNYQKNPDFLEKVKADLAARNITNIKGYFKLQKAKRAMALENLKMELKLFTDKKSAYQIDNSDREKWWIFKLGKKIDKLPRWAQTLGFTGTGVLVGLTGGALGLWVVGTSGLTTGTFAGMTGFKNFIKKWTHYTKEQNTHEKNMTRNLSNELAKIEKRKQDSLLKGAKNWYRSYRAKRQLNLYNNATQDFFGTKEISKKLLDFWATLNTPWDTEKAEILNTLVDAKARLEAYYQSWHNFLASEDLAHIESDMNELHMAIDMVCKKLGLEYTKIDSETAKKNLISDYNNSFSVFKKQRAKLAKKYGFTTGAASLVAATVTQWIMGTGMFSHEAVPWSTISKPNISGKEYFGLGSSDLGNVNTWWGQIHDGVKNAFDGLGDNATVNIHYGAGTDATQVLPWSKLLDTSAYHAKVADIIKEIDTLNLSKDQKLAFIKQLHDEPWKVEWNSKVFTSDILHGQRCAEWLLETARGLAHSGSKVVPEFSYDSAMNIAGSQAHNQAERFFNVNMEVVEHIPGKAGHGIRWWIPITGFANTFKKEPKNSDFSSPGETIRIEKPEINNATSEKKDTPVVFTAPAADNTLPDEREKQQKTIKEEMTEIRNTSTEKEKTMKKENQEEYERIYQKTGIDIRNINDKESRFVKFRDLNKKEFDKEFDFENKIYLTHHTIKDSAENIVKTGLHHHGVLQWTTNLVGEDIFKHLENAENGNYTHRNSDTVVILEFDKKEFDINPEEKSVIDRIWEKLMENNKENEYKLSVPPQYIKKVVSLDLKPKNLISIITPTINPAENEVTPTITPQVPEIIVEKLLVDEKRNQFTEAIREYRELIDKLDIPKKQKISLRKSANKLFGDVFSVDSDSKSPQEKIKQFQDGITLLTQLKKEMQRE